MHRVVVVLSMLLVCTAAPGSYVPLSLGELVGGADLITIGTITNVGAGTIDVRISETIIGQTPTTDIEVKLFENWTCAQRWADYESGQTIMFFLTKGDGKYVPADVWKIMGAGDEGEMPVVDDFIYPGILLDNWEAERQSHQVYGGTRLWKRSVKDFMAAISDIYACFRFTHDNQGGGPRSIRQLCTNAELAAWRNKSSLHRHLVDSIRICAEGLEDNWWKLSSRNAKESRTSHVQSTPQELWKALGIAEGFGEHDPRLAAALRQYAEALRSYGREEEASRHDARAAQMQYPPCPIMKMSVHGTRLLVRRWEYVFEAYDLETGKRLGSKVIPECPSHYLWGGHALRVGPNARLVAFCPTREVPIKVIALYGSEPSVSALTAPEDFEIGNGGFNPKWIGTETLLAETNEWVVELDLATGKEIRRTHTPMMWSECSPDGRYQVSIEGQSRRLQKSDNQYIVKIISRMDPTEQQSVTINGHGENPEMLVGLNGVYLTDQFAAGVMYLPYDGSEQVTFDAGNMNVWTESDDGRLIALGSPRIEKVNWRWTFMEEEISGAEYLPIANKIEVWDVAARKKLCEIDRREFLIPMFADGSRLVCKRLASDHGEPWWSETVEVFDAKTGALLTTLTLSE